MKILMDGKQSREFLASFPRFFLIVIKLTLLPTLSRFVFLFFHRVRSFTEIHGFTYIESDEKAGGRVPYRKEKNGLDASHNVVVSLPIQ